ncbi:glycosyltransferase family 15 protein [Mycena rebaudengoi]|nr:glycosyltransferase family 15 protein [Mycena rebaudengoi]
MMTRGTRHVALTLTIILSLHYILSFAHEGYGRATSFNALLAQFRMGGARPKNAVKVFHEPPSKIFHAPPYKTPVPDKYYLQDKGNGTFERPDGGRRANAVIVMLDGNLDGVERSMRQLEEKWNSKFKYPYVFLTEEPFSDRFKWTIAGLTAAKVEFGLIPRDHWYQPSFIDESRAAASRKDMEENKVIYGGSVPYRNMCRFNSGFFFRHPLLDKYRYYWRVEPDVKFFCNLDYDPFLFMQDEGKKYGFTISLPEYEDTIPTLWQTVKEFIAANPELISPDNAMGFLSDDGGQSYNNCHFWSNFEIADLDLWRSEAYMKFFEYLDSKGGFYYERWGDGPVHSIGAALFARKDQIHFFEDVGYRHEPFQHCPQLQHAKNRCSCDINENFDREGWSCLNRYDRIFT